MFFSFNSAQSQTKCNKCKNSSARSLISSSSAQSLISSHAVSKQLQIFFFFSFRPKSAKPFRFLIFSNRPESNHPRRFFVHAIFFSFIAAPFTYHFTYSTQEYSRRVPNSTQEFLISQNSNARTLKHTQTPLFPLTSLKRAHSTWRQTRANSS